MTLIGNILWIIFGGLISCLMYIVGGLLFCATIIGIPFGIQSIKLGIATLAPFGGRIVEKPGANSLLMLVCNAIWAVTFGFTLAVNHLFWAAVLALSIVGIPFAVQHLKLIPLCLLPFGRDLVYS